MLGQPSMGAALRRWRGGGAGRAGCGAMRRRLAAEVGGDDLRVGEHLVGWAAGDDPPLVEGDQPVGDRR